jgi:hypothetical protein
LRLRRLLARAIGWSSPKPPMLEEDAPARKQTRSPGGRVEEDEQEGWKGRGREENRAEENRFSNRPI